MSPDSSEMPPRISGAAEAGTIILPRKRVWLSLPNRYRLPSLIVVGIGWQLYAEHVNPLFLASPTSIVRAAIELTESGELPRAVWESAQTLFWGYAIAAILGVALGVLMGWYRKIDWILDPYVSALYATPNVALIPLIILWFGLQLKSKIVIVLLAALFPIIINTYSGVRGISASLVETALAYGARERQLFTKIVLPAALPFIMVGLRLAIGRAIVGMVVGEMFTRLTGLGGLIATYSGAFATDRVFVGIIVLALGGVLLTETLKLVERRLSGWVETARID
jgi:ABC-type nitrate/sulfonate/bicarbonate transport system permease component